MTVISATEFKAKCLHLLDEVQRTGQDLIISKRGRPVARVVAEQPAQPWLALRGKGRFKGDPFAAVVEIAEIDALK
ncbi:MAG: type II toxin-antitoxin system Phd/YefM family antitoxin [Akkermansiaceae bacterium]|nr:type II toxin-antitoxin system Phd/YefM family antitoxin [Akkermansiaceae bacterium]